MSEDTYNGWTGKGNRASAYATWRVNLELVDGDWIRDTFSVEKPTGYELADHIEEEVKAIVCGEDYDAEQLVTQYALAFLDDVNWDEIADHILSDWDD